MGSYSLILACHNLENSLQREVDDDCQVKAGVYRQFLFLTSHEGGLSLPVARGDFLQFHV